MKAEFSNKQLKVKSTGMIDILNPPPFGPFQNYKKEGNIGSPSFLERRQQHINFEASTKMEFEPKNEYEAAGIALVQNANHQFRLEYSIENQKKLFA